MRNVLATGRGRMALRGMVVAALLCGPAAFAAEDAGIRVTGAGSAKAKATQVEIECSISGDAELAADATVRFQDARKRALAAIAAMKNSDVTVASDGVSVTSIMDENAVMMRQRGMPVQNTKPRVQLLERNRIVLANIDKLSADALLEQVLKILDVARDAGFQVAGAQANNDYSQGFVPQRYNQIPGMVTFKIPDVAALRDQAYKDALEEAKAKAQKLAELSGVKIGKVVSIQDLNGGREQGEDRAVRGNSTGDLVQNVNLLVTFEILK